MGFVSANIERQGASSEVRYGTGGSSFQYTELDLVQPLLVWVRHCSDVLLSGHQPRHALVPCRRDTSLLLPRFPSRQRVVTGRRMTLRLPPNWLDYTGKCWVFSFLCFKTFLIYSFIWKGANKKQKSHSYCQPQNKMISQVYYTLKLRKNLMSVSKIYYFFSV